MKSTSDAGEGAAAGVVAPDCRDRVAVVSVAYNSGPYLLDMVERVLASTCEVEIVVSDNASRDGSIEALLERWSDEPRLKVLRHPENLGFATASNRALPWVDSDYVLFLNPDCMLEPNTLERMLKVLQRFPQAGMAGCLIRNSDGSEQEGCRRLEPTPRRALARVMRPLIPALRSHDFNLSRRPIPREPVEIDAISGAFMLVRRQALVRVGPLDEGYFLHAEDLDWCRRFRDAGFGVLFVPDVVVMHIKGTSSQATPIRVEWHKHQGMVRYFRKFYARGSSRSVLWLVQAAVWLRFALITVGRLVRSGKSPARD